MLSGINTLYEEDAETASLYGLEIRPPVLDSQSKLQNSGKEIDGCDRIEAREKVNKFLRVGHSMIIKLNFTLKNFGSLIHFACSRVAPP